MWQCRYSYCFSRYVCRRIRHGQPANASVKSGIFSMIYAMCLRGLGRHTKDGAVLITAATSGGAIIPPIMSAVKTHHGIRYSYSVVVAVLAFGAILPIYTTFVAPAKNQVDPFVKHNDGTTHEPQGKVTGLRFPTPKRRSRKSTTPLPGTLTEETPNMNDDKWPTMLN